MPPLTPRSSDEFPAGAAEWPEELSRRQFVELMAASLALAGLAGCNRPPDKTIVPYVTPPDRTLLDGTVYYATTMPWEGYGRGLLALSTSGRPTKLEGNPAHPDSLGRTDAVTQAAVLSLYDPDRSRAPRQGGATTAWQVFEDAWIGRRAELAAAHGAKLAILSEPTTSPTVLRAMHHLLDQFPQAKWYQHTALPRYDRGGHQEDYDFQRADVILAIDSNFLYDHPSALRYARAFADRRRIEHARVNANRLYVFEPTPTVTGSMADHRLPASPDRIRMLLNAVAAVMDGHPLPSGLTAGEQRVIPALAHDLRNRAPNVVCVAGPQCDDDLHAWAAAMNTRLRADGTTRHALPVVRSDGDPRAAGDLAALVRTMHAGEVDTIIIVGVNAAYAAPVDLDFAGALGRVRHRLHFGPYVDETAVRCDWHIPESHFLESWSDLRSYDGTASIVQPLIAAMYESRSTAEFLFFLADGLQSDGYDLVRNTWRKQLGAGGDFDHGWDEALYAGMIKGTASARGKPPAGGNVPPLRPAGGTPYTLVIRPDPTVRDGAWSNNGWLQELPKPLTQLVWGNAAHVSPSFASHHHLATGDLVRLPINGADRGAGMLLPVWITAGQAADCVTVHLGYGRSRAGAVGTNHGFDAYQFQDSHRRWAVPLSGVHRAPGRGDLVSTQTHFRMEGRDILRTVKASELATTAGPRPENPPSVYPKVPYPGYRWAMLIDLGACIGCKACVIACQAENNIPVVGKDQVSRGREMHWLRVDQYFEGDLETPELMHMPVPCMQCENAPCELVCPVAATVHSSEGLNDMVYNRCIGTRYCSNNCPYKVRRFNFFDYRLPANSPLYLQANPNVTIRARGVMEKCTYCVQRINAARINAEREDRRVRDGEIRTACQQVCPTDAIVFGDLNDPASRVRARKAEPSNYALLQDLDTRPRTTYLARLTNPSDEAETIKPART